jgi:hypothetical protein
MGILLTSVFNRSLDGRLAALHLSPELLNTINSQRFKLVAITLPGRISEQMHTTVTQAIKLSFIDGFRTVMLTSVTLALLSALVAGLMIAGKPTAIVEKSEAEKHN